LATFRHYGLLPNVSPIIVESLVPADVATRPAVPPRARDMAPAPAVSPQVVHHRMVYRVIMHGVRPGFSRLDVLRSVAHLFGQTPHRIANGLKRATVSRRLASAQAATRMAELLTEAGCNCSIEVAVDGAWGSEPALGPAPASAEGSSRPARQEPRRFALPPAPVAVPSGVGSRGRLERLRLAVQTWPDRFRSRVAVPLMQFGRDARDAMNRPFDDAWRRMGRYWTPGIQQFVFAFGALATLALLSNSIPGYSIPQPGARIANMPHSDSGNPLAPAIELRGVESVTAMTDASRPVHRVRTSAGEVSIEPDATRPRTWALTWEGVRLRDLHVDSVPTIMTRTGSRRNEPAVGEFTDEVVLVVDTGERRSAYCAASRMMLVVLPRRGIPRLQEVVGQCAELETVVVGDRRLLLHFYDRAAPSLVYQAGRLTRMVN